MELLAALSIGLMGSFHCVGMCGPIALALPLNRESKFSIVLGSSLYNIGRLFTYFLLGVLLGILGKGISFMAWQQGISITVGILMILSVFIPLINYIKLGRFNLLLGQLKAQLAQRLQQKSNLNLFLIGVFNGLLPCGLVYLAVLAAIATASPLEGGLFMALFGLGTFPLMLTVNLFGNQLKQLVYPTFKKFIPVFIILLGGLFILRGLGLGIPYISPIMHPTAEIIQCH